MHSFLLSSSTAFASASFTILSTSCSSNVEAPAMVMVCSFPVPLSLADTLRMPFASMSNATSIWGTPRGAGGTPSSLKLPRSLLSFASLRSPWNTTISTEGCESAAVENTSVFLVGMVVFLGISTVATPPKVSTPRDSGATSNKTMSFTSPARTPACTAAPMATTSSGFTVWLGSLPWRSSLVNARIAGILVDPPTSTTSSRSAGLSFASRSACSTGALQRSMSEAVSCSNLARERDSSICFGPIVSAVMNGRDIFAS
mmetsp:Transcript_11978/g.32087  ORF Transcript_11978/g.32087 Transcript_11978/m.32087 type:complete len:258 (+) Transcript_11978:515-1288(+)